MGSPATAEVRERARAAAPIANDNAPAEGRYPWYRNYHRYHDPATGRYTQVDPLVTAGLPISHAYAYVDGNPVVYDDPYGLVGPADAQAVLDAWRKAAQGAPPGGGKIAIIFGPAGAIIGAAPPAAAGAGAAWLLCRLGLCGGPSAAPTPKPEPQCKPSKPKAPDEPDDRCKKIAEGCRVECLPKLNGRDPFPYWNCINDCLRRNGCPEGMY